jgi:cbb3-type cytochrome oxidase subunit 3
MTPILFSLLALTVTFAALVCWAFSSKTRERWEQASQLPFDDVDTGTVEDD